MSYFYTRCPGGYCPFKTKCNLYEPQAEKIRNYNASQEYFHKPPYNHKDVSCAEFTGNWAEYLYVRHEELRK